MGQDKAKEKEMQVIIKAKELSFYTLEITSNCKTFPKKFRFTLVDRMQRKGFDIYERLLEANRARVENKVLRYELQTNAITYCEELLFYIESSLRLSLITPKRAEYWSGLVSDVKHMTLAWRKRDKDR
jgi:hypothetical protein